MSLDMVGIFGAARDQFLKTGVFEKVNGHEANNAVANGLTCDVIIGNLKTVPQRSGLATTSALISMQARVYLNALHQPADDIDPIILSAVDQSVNMLNGNYTLGGTVAEVDLLGEYGQGITGRMGYVERNQILYRTFTLTFDVVINDVWNQGA